MYKTAMSFFLTTLLLGCSPHINPVEETPHVDMAKTTDTTQPADMSHQPDTACAVGYMRCVENEQPVCVPERCGGCLGVVCSPNQPNCCGGACTNLNTYADNCGACGNVCRPGEWCADGVCVFE